MKLRVYGIGLKTISTYSIILSTVHNNMLPNPI